MALPLLLIMAESLLCGTHITSPLGPTSTIIPITSTSTSTIMSTCAITTTSTKD